MSIIVDESQRVIGLGYNGVPSGMNHCLDGGCPRLINNVPSGTSYDSGLGLCYSSHAEQNALSRGDSTRYAGATLYINGSPCMGCARQIACSGIQRVCILYEADRIGVDETINFLMKAQVRVLKMLL